MSKVELRSDDIFARAEHSKSLSVVVKISERCNLTCSYCYFFYGGDESYRQHPPVIRGATITNLVAFLQAGIQRFGLERINISLHGGEPLLMKRPAFDSFCATVRGALQPHCRVRLILQTNAVLIDPAWIDLFEKHDVQVGVSFDGDQPTHDVHRLNKRGRGTYLESRRGWELLTAAAAAGRIAAPGILCVIDPQADGGRIFNHFARELGCGNLNFLLPDVSHEDGKQEAFFEGCRRYLLDVVDAWRVFDPTRIDVRFIREIYLPLLSDRQALTASRLRNDSLQLLVVRSNGDVAPVDKISTAAPSLHSTSLNVASASLEEVLASATWRELIDASLQLPAPCEACEWRNICRGGPLNTRYSAERGFDNPSVYCDVLKSLYRHVTNVLVAAGAPAAEVERRLTRPAARAPADRPSEAA